MSCFFFAICSGHLYSPWCLYNLHFHLALSATDRSRLNYPEIYGRNKIQNLDFVNHPYLESLIIQEPRRIVIDLFNVDGHSHSTWQLRYSLISSSDKNLIHSALLTSDQISERNYTCVFIQLEVTCVVSAYDAVSYFSTLGIITGRNQNTKELDK